MKTPKCKGLPKPSSEFCGVPETDHAAGHQPDAQAKDTAASREIAVPPLYSNADGVYETMPPLITGRFPSLARQAGVRPAWMPVTGGEGIGPACSCCPC